MTDNPYDLVAFPSMATRASHPDHLATIARLHGLSPPPIATARVLDIGGGDGMNLLAMAEASPDAKFLSIDLAEQPVARGQAIARAAGIANVRVEVADIVEAAQSLDGPFDYVVSHGVYAWTPAPVRDALMALVGRVLSPDGVAYVSYNASPGSDLRRIVRDMVLHEIDGVTDPAERYAAARAVLAAYAEPRDGDSAALAGLRTLAAKIGDMESGVLLHDELGAIYAPQAFADVIAHAERHGLRFLNSANPHRVGEGLPGDAVDDAALVRRIQSRDHAELRYFHKTAFVRSDRAPSRTPSIDALRGLHAAAPCDRTGPGSFRSVNRTVTIGDAALVRAMDALVDAFPQRLPLAALVEDDDRLAAVLRLYEAGLVTLHTVPTPGVAVASDRPRASGLARALVEAGESDLFGLDQRTVILTEPGPRALIRLLDGTRDRATLAADWAASGHAMDVPLDEALRRLAHLTLLAA